jgi:gluconolactonase
VVVVETMAPLQHHPPHRNRTYGVEILTSAANPLIDASPAWEVVGTKGQFNFTEGPVWDTETGSWIWSDIPENIQYQHMPAGAVTQFRNPSNKANGNMLESNGTLLTCEHVGRAVVRVDVASKVRTVVVDSFNGSKLTSPNDLVIFSKTGALYFTDPSYGSSPLYGHGQPSDQEFNHVFRLDRVGDGFATEPVSLEKEIAMPNGIVFNLDETKLYVSDASVDKVYEFDVAGDGSLSNKAVFADIAEGDPDGLKMSASGHLWVGTKQGVSIYALDKTMVAKIHTPEIGANLQFGGADGMDLMITASSSVWIVKTKVKAASLSLAGSMAFI